MPEQRNDYSIADFTRTENFSDYADFFELDESEVKKNLEHLARFADVKPKNGKTPLNTPINPIQQNLTEKVIEFLSDYLIVSSEPDALLLPKVIDGLKYLNKQQKSQVISSLGWLMKQEGNNNVRDMNILDPIMEIFYKKMEDLSSKMKDIFNGDSWIKKNDPRYQRFKSARTDIVKSADKLVSYAQDKFDLRARYDPRATDICYDECFPSKKKISQDIFISFLRDPNTHMRSIIDSEGNNGVTRTKPNGKAKYLVRMYGSPFEVKRRGNKASNTNTLKFLFGSKGETEIKIHYKDKIPQQEARFLYELARMAPNTKNTGKAINYIQENL